MSEWTRRKNKSKRQRACPVCGFVRQVSATNPDALCRSCRASESTLESPTALVGGEWVAVRGIQRWVVNGRKRVA